MQGSTPPRVHSSVPVRSMMQAVSMPLTLKPGFTDRKKMPIWQLPTSPSAPFADLRWCARCSCGMEVVGSI